MEALYAKFSSGNTRATSSSIIEEYQEDEVWAVLDKPKEDPSNTLLFDASSAWGVRAPRPIMRATSLSGDQHHHHGLHRYTITNSAPVSTPDWCKFLNITLKKNLQISDDECDQDGEDDDMLPPHEFLARRYARNRVVSSMYEGVGRTLKGRDLINFRNAIFRKTGFIE